MDPLLYISAMQGDKSFLQMHADPSYLLAQTPQMNTALHINARFGRVSFAETIISACPALLDMPNGNGDTPLHVAARGGFIDLVKLLTREYPERAHDDGVERGRGSSLPPHIRRVNNAGNTALHEALKNGHGMVARHLLGLDDELLSVVNNNVESPLYLAAEVGISDAILTEMLKQRPGSFSTVQTSQGKTPLHAASIRGHTGIVKVLLREVPELISHKDVLGRTALHYAVTHSATITQILLTCDHKLAYEVDNEGLSPLLIAIRYWNHQIAATILRHCPDCIELRDHTGRNVLHIAATEPTSLLTFLLKRPEMHGLINEADYDGNTPLHLATKCHYYKNASKLVSVEGIDLNSRNKDGHTAKDICEITPGISYRKRLVWHALCEGKAVLGREHLKGAFPENVLLPFANPNADLQPSANTLSVVAALLATVSCAAAFTVPGGYKNDGPQEGLAVLARKAAFKIFLLADAVTMCASLSASFALTGAMWGDDTLLRNVFVWCLLLVYVSLVGVSVSFATGTFVIVSRLDLGLAIMVCIIACMAPLVPCIFFRFLAGNPLAFWPKIFMLYVESSQQERGPALLRASQPQTN